MNKRVDLHPVIAAWDFSPATAFDAWIRQPDFDYSLKSITVYSAVFGKFIRFLTAHQLVLSEVTPTILREFLDGEVPAAARPGRSGPLSNGTKKRYLALLSNVFTYLQEEGGREDNPALALAVKRKKALKKKQARRLPVALSRHEVGRFKEHFPRGMHWKAARDKALLHLLLGTGLRVSEALALTLDRLYLDETPPYVQVIGKGDKERQSPVSADGLFALRAWLNVRATLDVGGGLAFPASLQGEMLAPSTTYRLVRRTLRAAGIVKPRMGPHVLRHTFATRQLTEGHPLALVKNWMGHDWITTTALYEGLVLNPGGVMPV